VLPGKAQLSDLLIRFSQISQERAKRGGSLDLGSTVRVAHRRNTSRAYQRCTRSTFPFFLNRVAPGFACYISLLSGANTCACRSSDLCVTATILASGVALKSLRVGRLLSPGQEHREAVRACHLGNPPLHL